MRRRSSRLTLDYQRRRHVSEKSAPPDKLRTVTNQHSELLNLAADRAIDYLDGIAERPVGATADTHWLTTLLGGRLPDGPATAADTIDVLSRAASEGGMVASSGHLTVNLALQYLGFGTEPVHVVHVDDQGAMRVDALANVLATCDEPKGCAKSSPCTVRRRRGHQRGD